MRGLAKNEVGEGYTLKEAMKEAKYLEGVKKIRNVVFAILLASLFVFAAMAIFGIINDGIGRFVATLLSINITYYMLAFIVLFCGYLLRFPKWEFYMKRLKVKIGRWDNFMTYLSLYSMDITPGRWGRGVVSYTINRITGTSFAKTFSAVVADIFTDFLGFSVLALLSALLLHKYESVSLFIAAVLLLPFVFLFNRGPFLFIKKRFGHIKRLGGFFEAGEAYFKNNKMLGRKTYAYSMLFTVPSQLINGMALYMVILSFGIKIGVANIPAVLFIYSSSLLLGMITGIPATLGVTDAALVSYLTIFFSNDGINLGTATLITIFFRIVSVWFVEGFGFAAFFYTLKYWKHKPVPSVSSNR